ncbi:MAG: TldD/PmbA family protein [Gloeomargaritaceae cyanobacterium C42_A2020_066]|nr:TldD/PmbA family protein [Gloeomargaritaceae cyanobacterium C42_A2020_066]
MGIDPVRELEQGFNRLAAEVCLQAQADEWLTLEVDAERSQFIRFNQARVRQTGWVADGEIRLTLIWQDRCAYRSLPFTGHGASDCASVQAALTSLRQEVRELPPDPHVVRPADVATSREVYPGALLPPEQVVPTLMPVVAGLDFTGCYAGGQVARAYADSAGQKHWFATESFTLDYSLWADDERAVKGNLAGSHWDQAQFASQLHGLTDQLAHLGRPTKAIPRGTYRTYLGPAAVADLVSMLSWGGLSEAALQQGVSALGALRRGEKTLSPQFCLGENFSHGLVPRFNHLGQMAPMTLPLIEDGQLVNTLISSRTAREYGLEANGAGASEAQRAPEVSPGSLPEAEVLTTLGTGLYLSNLHYLNWSDRPAGRITGMTRFACFWVEAGELVTPIVNLRFDESLYRFWGDQLVGLTDTLAFIPEVGTYGQRHLGGTWAPGMVVEDFTFTL